MRLATVGEGRLRPSVTHTRVKHNDRQDRDHLRSGRPRARLAARRGPGRPPVNTHGTQVVDCWAWSAEDPGEHMSMEATRVWTQHLNPRVGDTFVTTRRRPILTLVEDTSRACTTRSWQRATAGATNCSAFRTTTATASTTWPRPWPISASLPPRRSSPRSTSQNIAVQDDRIDLGTQPTVCRPGDYVTLRADRTAWSRSPPVRRTSSDPGESRQHAPGRLLCDPGSRVSAAARQSPMGSGAMKRRA